MVEAEERARAAKAALAGLDPTLVVTSASTLGELADERRSVDRAEARFEAAYAELQRRRALLAEPAFLASLEEANAIDAFSSYVGSDMPEEAFIAAAVTAYLDQIASIRRRHEEALARHSRAMVLVRQLGIPTRELPESYGVLNDLPGRQVIRRAAARAAAAWRQARQGEGELAVLTGAWFPDWSDPHESM